MKKIFLSFFLLILITITISYFFLNSKVNSEADFKIVIEKNMSINDAVKQLNKQNILLPSFFYKAIIKIYAKQINAKIFIGTHLFSSNMTN